MTGPILYFIVGEAPTNDEFLKAMEFSNKGPFLEFVSLAHMKQGDELVNASGVAGAVPAAYAEAYTVLDKLPVNIAPVVTQTESE